MSAAASSNPAELAVRKTQWSAEHAITLSSSLRYWPWIAKTLWRAGVPQHIVRFDGGIGDDLMCTALFREWAKRNTPRSWFISDHAAMLAGNPDIRIVIPKWDWRVYYVAWMQKRTVITPYYEPPDFDSNFDPNLIPREHLIAAMCRTAGIKGQVALRPYVHLSPAEVAAAKVADNAVAVQVTGASARHAMRNKEWFPDRFQRVVNQLKDRYTFVQIGMPSDPLLENVTDLRGKTTLRQTAATLAASRFFLGLVGFPMHLARAVNTRAVIVYGGREQPWQSGYSCNENVTNQPHCSPCWRANVCPIQQQCMRDITSDQVIRAIERIESRLLSPLEEDTVTI